MMPQTGRGRYGTARRLRNGRLRNRRPLIVISVLAAFVLAGVAVAAWPRDPYLFALIGDGTQRLEAEREAGIEAKVFRLSWRKMYPAEGEVDRDYLQRKQGELEQIEDAGFEVILEPGYHDTPLWVHESYEDSYYVDQLGQRYRGENFVGGVPADNGDANLVFNHDLRGLVASYMREVFSEFGDDFYAVRAGGGRYGELTYPPSEYSNESNLYWAYDDNAQGSAEAAGVAGWRPGDASPNGEARRFLDWYLGELVGYQNWQIDMVREAGYGGRIMMLYPGWGLRPGQAERAVENNLSGDTPAERSGELPSGHAFARQVAAIDDPEVVVTTTWLDADASGDAGEDAARWSPVKYLASLAKEHSPALELYGENTGQGSSGDMFLSAHQMRRYDLLGMAWYNERELFSGDYAGLREYARLIESIRERRRV